MPTTERGTPIPRGNFFGRTVAKDEPKSWDVEVNAAHKATAVVSAPPSHANNAPPRPEQSAASENAVLKAIIESQVEELLRRSEIIGSLTAEILQLKVAAIPTGEIPPAQSVTDAPHAEPSDAPLP